MRFKDITPIRASLAQRLIAPLFFLVCVILGGPVTKIIGLIGLLLIIPRHFTDRARVELTEEGFMVRTQVWATIKYGEISKVERRDRELFPGPLKLLETPRKRVISESMANSPVAVYLKEPKWLWVLSPIPLLVKHGLVDVYLSEEDEKVFTEALRERLD